MLLTIFSPFFFLMGAIPGFEGVTISWAKRMLASALTFPAILVIIYVAVYLIGGIEWRFLASGFIPGTDAGVNPPPPIGPAGKFVNLSVLAGIGVLFFASQIPNAIDDMLGIRAVSGRGFGPGSVVGGALGGMAFTGNLQRSVGRIQESGMIHRMLATRVQRDDSGRITGIDESTRTPFGNLINRIRGRTARGVASAGSVKPEALPPTTPAAGETTPQGEPQTRPPGRGPQRPPPTTPGSGV